MKDKKSSTNVQKTKPSSASADHCSDPVRRQVCIDLAGGDEPMVFIDGHDDAIIGVADCDGDDVVVYDIKKIIGRLRRRDGMSKDDAEEFFAYNIGGMFAGVQSRIFVNMLPDFNS